jgi:hypothetical protein
LKEREEGNDNRADMKWKRKTGERREGDKILKGYRKERKRERKK